MEGIPNILGFIDSSVQDCLHEKGRGRRLRDKKKRNRKD
jgi:hypothetical protein